MDWRVKGAIQKILSVVPGGRRLNSTLQWKFGGLRRFDEHVDDKVVADWLVLAARLRELRIPMAGRTFMEIGTGWFPTLPACFSLAGVSRCVTFDVNRLLDWQLTQRMLVALTKHLESISHAVQIPQQEVQERWRQFSSARNLDDFLERTGIEYRAPRDATSTGLEAQSVDVVFSNSVLEHVEQATIRALMRETRRILRRGGLAVHSVNCGDHYAYFDRSVTQIHYLRFCEPERRLWNNSVHYQNRLGANDFIDIAAEEGLSIVLNRQKPRVELLARFDDFPIAPEFRRYSKEQLCTTSIDFVAQVSPDLS